MEKIIYKNELLGIVIRTLPNGTTPLTDEKEPLQVMGLKHEKDTILKAHAHAPRERVTARLQECLVVKKGKIKIDLYGDDKKLFKCLDLSAGDLFISMGGGLGIHFADDAEVFEMKNGPFKEDKILI